MEMEHLQTKEQKRQERKELLEFLTQVINTYDQLSSQSVPDLTDEEFGKMMIAGYIIEDVENAVALHFSKSKITRGF